MYGPVQWPVAVVSRTLRGGSGRGMLTKQQCSKYWFYTSMVVADVNTGGRVVVKNVDVIPALRL